MGVMNKMRENTKYVLYFLVVSFGILWMIQDTGAFDVVGYSAGNTIAIVDGDPITTEEYNNAVEQTRRNQESSTGESLSPQQLDNLRNSVYYGLIDQRIIERELERLGLEVTDEELYDLFMGDNPHPVVLQYFGDGEGGVNRALLQSYIDNLGQDPEQDAVWLNFEEQLRHGRRIEKLRSLFASAVRVSDAEVEAEYLRRNLSADVRYVPLRYAAIPDDSVSLTDIDLRRFYNEHQENFARERAYTFDYVTVSLAPSAQDSAAILQELTDLKSRFAEAEDDSLFLARHDSRRPYSSTYFRADDLDPDVANAVFDAPEAGTVIGPVFVDNQARLIKIQDVREGETPVVHARHILIRTSGDDAEAKERARVEAEDLRERIVQNGEDFGTMARLYSSDNVSAAQGGDLGWFDRERMTEPFANAAFDARIGEVVGPVETEFGYHIIEVLDQTSAEVRLADYAMDLSPSVGTFNDVSERLDDFRYFATEADDFRGEAERRGLSVQQVQVEAEQAFIPGIGQSRGITGFLEGADVGAISPVIELNDAMLVGTLTEIQEEGYRPFEEVRSEIEPRARLEVKKNRQVERLRSALQETGFDGLAETLGAPERSVATLTFNTQNIPDLGNDLIFKGTVFGLSEGATSGVVAGQNAAFVVHVDEMVRPDAITDEEREQIRTQLVQQRQGNQFTGSPFDSWITNLRENADVEDFRRRFEQ